MLSGFDVLSAAPKAYRFTKSEVTAVFPLQLAKVVPVDAALTVKLTLIGVAAS
jgi:hypothetical protein